MPVASTLTLKRNMRLTGPKSMRNDGRHGEHRHSNTVLTPTKTSPWVASDQ